MNETYDKVFTSPINTSNSKQLYSFARARRFRDTSHPKYPMAYAVANSSTILRAASLTARRPSVTAIKSAWPTGTKHRLQTDMRLRAVSREIRIIIAAGVSAATRKRVLSTTRTARPNQALEPTTLTTATTT